jgi:uncharacterized protein YprB with RNaseH-like and TPR domain
VDAPWSGEGSSMKTAYLDIETTYLGRLPYPRLCEDYRNHKITVIGIRILDAANDTFVQLAGNDITRDNLMRALEGVECLVTYNGRSIPDKVKGYIGFDFPVIAAQLGVVLDREFKHVDLCPLCWKANLWGGLKAVEQRLGLKRKLPGKDGKWADETWKQYLKTGRQSLLDDLLAYNREDVFMLRRLEEALAARR